MIVVGMWTQAGAILLVLLGSGFGEWVAAMALLGLGTALVYPTLLAAISDVAHPDWRASAVGVYRLWRDGGYAVGALLAGVVADLLGVPFALEAAVVAHCAVGRPPALLVPRGHATAQPQGHAREAVATD